MNKNKSKTPAQIVKDIIDKGGLRKNKKSENKPNKDFGGLLQGLAPLADLALPGLGTGLSAMLGAINANDELTRDPLSPITEDTTPYMRKGGTPAGFKQYNTLSHEQGGMPVNKQGVPDYSNAVAEIETNENSYRYSMLPGKNEPYVFSDVNGTADLVKDIINKYKSKEVDSDLPTRTAMELEVKDVENINETINNITSSVNDFVQARYGKKLEEKRFGDTIIGGMDLFPGAEQYARQQNPYTPPIPSRMEINSIGGRNSYDLADYRLPGQPFINSGGVSPSGIRYVDSLSNPTGETFANTPLPSNDPFSNLTPGPTAGSNNFINPFMQLAQNAANVAGQTDNQGSVLDQGQLGAILRGAGIVASGLDAFQSAEVEKPILPDYSESDARFDRMSADLTQARQDALGGFNRGSELNRGAASSYSQYRARELGNIGNLQDSLGRIASQEQQIRNSISGMQGQYEANKAATNAQILDTNQQRNLANVARAQDLRKQFFSDIVHEGDRLSTAQNIENITEAKIAEGRAILGIIAPDFDVSDEMVKKLIGVSKGTVNVNQLTDDELIVYKRLNT